MGEIATRHDNLRIPITAKDRTPGDTPYYGANGIQDYVEGYTHEGEFVLVAEDGATDLDNYPVQLISGLSWVNNHAHVIKAIPDVAQNRFIMHLIKSMDMGLRQESCTCPSPFYCACCAANGGTGYPSLLLCSARVS